MTILKAIFDRLHREWGLSIRRQLLWSFSLGTLTILLGSGYLLYSYQRHFQYEQGTQSAMGLARALSYSSTSSVLANDLVGLQEILNGASAVADIKFALVLSPQGDVLASTRPEYLNRYLSDAVSRRMLEAPLMAKVLQDETNLVDVAVPVKSGGRLAGWVRVVMTRDSANANLREVALAGAGMASLLVLIIIYIATRLARSLTQGLARLTQVANDAEHGQAFLRLDGERNDEVGVLARHLYRMLDARESEEKAKIESEERFRVVFNNAAVGLAQVSVSGQFMQINQEFCRVIGYTQQEVLSQNFNFQQITFPDDLAANMAYVDQLLGGERDSYSMEKRYIRKDGSLIWVSLSVYLLRDEAGKPLYFISAILDSSERKRAEELTRAASLYARSLIEASLDPLVTISAEGKITDVNRATEKVTGSERTELIGTDFSNYFTEPDTARAGYRQVFAQGYVTDYPLVLRHRDGHLTDVLYNASVYRDEAGSVLGVFAAARDITERKKAEFVLRQSEEGLKEAQRIAHLGSWHMDIATGQVFWSEELYKIYGFDPALPPPLYTESMKLFTPQSWERLNAAIAQAIENGISYELELETVRKDGGRGWMLARGELVRDAHGTAVRVRGVVMDITERKHAEAELRRYKDHLEDEVQQRTSDLVLARDAAEAANRAKSIFLSSMSHELRTPMNAILGFSGLMSRDTQLSEEQRENLDIINRSGEHLLTLINDVLEMAKIESGRVQVEREPIDLGALVRDVSDMMTIRANEKGLQLLVDQSSEFPRYIRGDEPRLRQVLINLVGNAVKFTRQGGITMRFGMKPDSAAGRLLIEVEDSGIGIKEADQLRIFEPFVQVGEISTQKGTGLGLAISRQFVELMGGTIGVESVPGVGSTFRVELPVEKVDACEVSRPEPILKGEIAGLAAGQATHRILIVEDQLENQLLLSRLMKQVGFEVQVAENGRQGVELFQSWHPNLIWMDRRMPVMDGIEATRCIRALPEGHDVKIVAVTASAFMEQREEMLEAGMDEFVRKPYRFSEIYECLARQLGVQYRYAEVQETEQAVTEQRLTPDMLDVLPDELCSELKAALESLEDGRIAAAIGKVGTYDASLQKRLTHLAVNFDYPVILEALHADQRDA